MDFNFVLNNNDLDLGGNFLYIVGGIGGFIFVILENVNFFVIEIDEEVLIVDENGLVIVGGC